MNGLKVVLMLMLSSMLVLLCGCSGGGGSSLASLPGVMQPTIVASASPTPGSTASPSSASNPTGAPADEVNPEEGSPTDNPTASEEGYPTDSPSGSPAEDSGGSGGTPPPPGSVPSAEEEPSPEPTAGSGSDNPGEDPSPDMIPVDELDRLFPNLPPDPGEAGKQTLEGIDTDGDGVRDDVQRWIYRRYPNEELKRKAMLQYARAYQEVLLAVNNRDLSNQKVRVALRAVTCIHEVWGFDAQGGDLETLKAAAEEREILKLQLLNTEARVRANFKSNANFSGERVSSLDYPRGANCDF